MKKIRTVICLSALLLLLSSCGGKEVSYAYQSSDHTHIYGNWYEVTPVTCMSEGCRIHYCKICNEPMTEVIPISDDISQRVHAFSDTVIPPTEAEYGYTIRLCTLCGYVVERANPVPPLYALLADQSDPGVLAPEGADAFLLSDTVTHRLLGSSATDSVVNADFARRLAVALTVTQEAEKTDGRFGFDTAVTTDSGPLAGETFTVGELLSAFVGENEDTCLPLFADCFKEDSAAFAVRVNRRVSELLGERGATSFVFSGDSCGQTVLYDVGVLLLRSLDTPILAEILRESVPSLCRVAGCKPVVFRSEDEGKLLIAAIAGNGGTVRFVLLSGQSVSQQILDGILAQAE